MQQTPAGSDPLTPRHPIRVVAERTGLSTDVLRAWEKRYGVVAPHRSDTGQRLYTDADVERLLTLRRATDAGRPIGRIAELTPAELGSLVREDEEARARREQLLARTAGPEADTYMASALTAVRELDAAGLDAVLVQAALRLGAPVFLEDVAAPLLRRIGDDWHRGALRAAHEHLASAVIRRVLSWLLWTAGGGAAGTVVVATPAGHVHEMGGLLSAAVAAGEGWRVVYLGADLPADEIARVAREAGADMVALSLVFPLADALVAGELRRLRGALPDTAALVVGGSGADSYAGTLDEIGARQVTDLAAFRRLLKGRSGGPASSNGDGA